MRIALTIACVVSVFASVSCGKKAETPSSKEPVNAKRIEPMAVTGPAPDSMKKRAQTQGEPAAKKPKTPEEAARAKEERQKKRAEKKAAKEAKKAAEMKESADKLQGPPEVGMTEAPAEPTAETESAEPVEPSADETAPADAAAPAEPQTQPTQ
jgi:hypothetical protein